MVVLSVVCCVVVELYVVTTYSYFVGVGLYVVVVHAVVAVVVQSRHPQSCQTVRQ